MIDISHLFIGSAWAQTAAPSSASGAPVFMNFIPLLIIFGIFYVLIIHPQQKKMNEQTKMIKALQRGDRVVTSGGIHGKIIKVEGDEHIILEVADGVHIKIVKSHVGTLAAKTEPAANDGKASDKS